MAVNRLRILVAAGGVTLAGGSQTLRACAVCFGDPNDPVTQAASAGILFLAVVIYGVLFSFVGITAFWVVRARRLAETVTPSPEAGDKDNLPKNE